MTQDQVGMARIVAHGGRVCRHGEVGLGWLGPHHCHHCLLSVAASCAAFAADVARGIYDADGYTPAERRRRVKKAKKRENRNMEDFNR